MPLQQWLKSNADYTRKLVHSAVEGAHSGEGNFLQGEPLTPFLCLSARSALKPAVIGAFIGALAAYSESRPRSRKTLAYGLLGCAVGFGAGFTWESRRLGASIATSTWKLVGNARDEHWLEKNPINYA
jgi:hypothetical protein